MPFFVEKRGDDNMEEIKKENKMGIIPVKKLMFMM